MGLSWSSMSECLGDFSNNPSASQRYGRLPPSRRVTSHSSPLSSAGTINSSSSPSTSSYMIETSPTTATATATTTTTSNSNDSNNQVLRQRCISEEKVDKFHHHHQHHKTSKSNVIASSNGAAIAPPPPPLIPDANSVYNLLEDESEDVCPTCLECYTNDNPKIYSKCGHSFHLQCIIAWEIRSGSKFCPICAKVMEYVEA